MLVAKWHGKRRKKLKDDPERYADYLSKYRELMWKKRTEMSDLKRSKKGRNFEKNGTEANAKNRIKK